MITKRLFSGSADLELILALRKQIRPMAFVGEYPGKADIEEALADTDTRKTMQLWFWENSMLPGHMSTVAETSFGSLKPRTFPLLEQKLFYGASHIFARGLREMALQRWRPSVQIDG